MTATDRVQISLHAQKLKNVAGAFHGTSDPYAVVTLVASEPGQQPKILGKTEVIKNNLSPQWVTTFELDYEFAKPTRINVGIYDEVKKKKGAKPMGSAMFEIGEILGARGNIKAKKIKGGGTLFCRVQKAPMSNAGTFYFQLRGVKLKNVDGMFSKSDPFFEVSKQLKGGGGPTWQVVYRSEVIQNDLNPKWKAASVSVNDVCGGDKDQPVLISVFDFEKNGRHNSLGSFETTVNALLHAKVPTAAGDPKRVDMSKAFVLKKRGQPFGNVVVAVASVEGENLSTGTEPPNVRDGFANALATPATAIPVAYSPAPTPTASMSSRPKFVDYLSGGLELQLSVAIDFTGSNGDPRKPGTLHYIDRSGSQLNDYEKALTAVGSIVARYDSDQKFPMLGFGAKFRGIINHAFQLGPTPEVNGIKGMLDAYRGTFKTGLTMSGPTVFSEVIQLAAAQARSKQEASRRIGQQAYHILLILTDGAVSDINETKRAIRSVSDAPLSIVIVGIGGADFSAMQFLDDFMSQEGAGRDICQYVEFQRHQSNKIHLTQATLEEIPDQVVDYFHGNGIKPLPEIHGSRVSIVADEYNEDEEIDLNLDIDEEGEINLGSDCGGVVDDTGYGTYDTFAGVTPLPPPSTYPQAYAPQQRYGAPPQGSYAPNASAPPDYGQSSYAQPFPPPQHSYGQPQVVTASVVTQPVFHVQVPPGVFAGQQLQIVNPQTQLPMIVTVPEGVPAGGVFPVPY